MEPEPKEQFFEFKLLVRNKDEGDYPTLNGLLNDLMTIFENSKYEFRTVSSYPYGGLIILEEKK